MTMLPSDQKLPKVFVTGTARLQFDINRINRIAALGVARRVPCSEIDGNGTINCPLNGVGTRKEALLSDVSKESEHPPNSIEARKTESERGLTQRDCIEGRKRKADRNTTSCQESIYLKHGEGRPYPNARNQLDIFVDWQHRKPIELAKDLFDMQGNYKENINPHKNSLRKETKKQIHEHRAEKYHLQVLKKSENAQAGSKVGSLLMRKPVVCFKSDTPITLPVDACGVKGNKNPEGPVHNSEGGHNTEMQPLATSSLQAAHHVEENMSDSLSISQPLQSGFHKINPQSAFAQASSSLFERNDQNEAVRELSSSMGTLAIRDKIVHHAFASEKSEPQAEVAYSNDVPSAVNSKPNSQSCVVASGFAHTSTSACSIAVGTASAPFATSTSDSLIEQSNALNDPIPSSPPLNKYVSVMSGKILKLPEVHPANSKQQINEHPDERQPLNNPSPHQNGAVKTLTKASQNECISEARGAKLVLHLDAANAQEKKRVNAGDLSTQQKKQGETQYMVWVNGKRYQKLKKIGRGGSSVVYTVVDQNCNIYALKRIKLTGRNYATACGFYQEIEYLNRLRGKHYIIRLIDHEITDKNLFSCEYDPSHVIRDDVFIYMVLEYGEIDLANLLEEKLKERTSGSNQVDETWLRFYWQQILEAVNTIHEERIVHSDLKPANFLLVKGVLKLIDFGIAKSIQSDTTNIEREAMVGTINYMSPEAFLLNEKDENGQIIKCGRPSDIWSLGCIFYQMVYGKPPFAHITNPLAKMQVVVNPEHKVAFPPLSNPYLIDTMKKCLAWRKEDRLRIPQLLSHPFLQPHLAVKETEPKEVLLQLQEEHCQDLEVRILIDRLLGRLKVSKNDEGS